MSEQEAIFGKHLMWCYMNMEFLQPLVFRIHTKIATLFRLFQSEKIEHFFKKELKKVPLKKFNSIE